ncbi:MAG: flagellar basal body protein [Alphaproteobacteria bacterium]|nr:flagellar basal body protein [Alphaproteobacteria bacterium]
MDFTGIPLFNMMQSKLKYHAANQSVLARNVANADTPGYRAQAMAAPDFASMMGKTGSASSMSVTSPMHMRPGMGKGGMSGNIRNRENTYELNPIGNNVVIEEEVMRVAENQAEYQKTLGIYKKSMELFRIAIGKSSGG